MKNWLTPLLLAVVCGTFAGCSSNSVIIATGLKAELQQIERDQSGTIHVTLRLNNPNIVPYLVDRSVHRVTIDGVMIGTFTDETRVALPAQNHADRTAVLTPANAAAAERIAQLAGKGPAGYQLDSTLYLLIYDDEIVKASLNHAGSVPVLAK